MSRTCRGLISDSTRQIEYAIDNIEVYLREVGRILQSISYDEILGNNVNKLGEVECILDNLLYELKQD